VIPGSQLIVNTGGATPYNNIRTVVSKTDSTHVVIDQGVNWTADTFSYIKYPQSINTTGALTATGTVSFLSNYEGIGGIYIPKMDMLVGGGNDGVFKFRQEDIATKPNSRIVFGNHKENTTTSNTMTIDTRNVRVGIGTLAPENQLAIHGDAANPTRLLLKSDAGAQGPFIRFVHGGEAGGKEWQIGSSGTNNRSGVPGNLEFWYDNGVAGGEDRMIITPAGNVGIGTNDPGSRFEVSDGIRSSGNTDRMLSVHGNASGATMHTAAFYNNLANGVGSFGYGLTLGAKNADTFGSIQSGQFDNNGALSGPGLNLILNPDWGNVGIGTSTVPSKLTVNGSVSIGSGAANGAGAPGKAICMVTATRTIGVCSTQPDATGDCTCLPVN
jgi:hypothetical protein